MISLSWPQVNTWRLAQHHLLQRAEPGQMLEVVSQICGLHAQLMPAAELALAARVEALSPADVQAALWQDRTLVKTWAMRGTLHLLPSAEFPLYVAAFKAYTHFRRGSWYKYHGVNAAELEALIEGVRTTLGSSGMTREQLAAAVAAQMNKPELQTLLLSGWGALLKPAAFQGYLCFGPNQGQQVTFVHPAQWLETQPLLDTEAALQEIARRYLAAYGPATLADFGRWWGMEPAKAKKLFRSLGAEIEAVEIEGQPAWALVSTLEQMPARPVSGLVRLLPYFDPYVVGMGRESPQLLPEAHKGRVYRSQGWISPVVLVDGRIEGVWEYDKKRTQTVVTIEMFTPPTAALKAGIEAEARRLGGFLGSEVTVTQGIIDCSQVQLT
jgi:hypothetical protein